MTHNVGKKFRFFFLGTALVVHSVESLINHECDEVRFAGKFFLYRLLQHVYFSEYLQVVLETETTNDAALRLYENLGFARHKRLLKYYLNGVDAFRLKLWLRFPAIIRERGRMSLMETLQADPDRDDPEV